MTLRRLMLVAAALSALAAACSSDAAPAVTVTGPTLTTVPPIGTAPPSTTATTPSTTSAPATSSPPVTAPPIEDPKPGVARFIPTLPLENGVLSLDVVFVDGSTSHIEWPADLDLVSGGLIPYGWAFIAGGTSRDFFIRPGTIEDVMTLIGGGDRIGEYPNGNGGTIGLWRPQNDDVDYLGFQFDDWAVLVYDYRAEELKMSEEVRGLWATNFHGELSEDGFLVLSADDPLQLVFAGNFPAPLNMTMRGADGDVTLTPGACDAGISNPVDDDAFVVWCAERGDMTVQVYGTTEFQQAVLDGLAVRSVVIAEPPQPPEA